MKFRFMEDPRGRWPVQMISQVQGFATTGYDTWRSRAESDQAERRHKMPQLIQVVHAEHPRRYGSPCAHRELLAMRYSCSENFIATRMRTAEIQAKTKRKFGQTTDSCHKSVVSPNWLNQDFTVKHPNPVGLPDITSISTREGWL